MNFDTFFDKAKNVANATTKKAGEVFGVSKLKLEAVQLNGEIEKFYKHIGELTYNSLKDNIDVTEEIKSDILHIDDLLAQIAEVNAKINANTSTIKCENCGATNSNQAIFCQRCGKTLIVADYTPKNETEDYINMEVMQNENEDK